MHCTRAVDKVNSFGQGDVLPDFGFTWNGCSSADFLFFQRVDNAGFSYVWISDKTDTDVFLVPVENVKLSEQIDQRAFSERIGD